MMLGNIALSILLIADLVLCSRPRRQEERCVLKVSDLAGGASKCRNDTALLAAWVFSTHGPFQASMESIREVVRPRGGDLALNLFHRRRDNGTLNLPLIQESSTRGYPLQNKNRSLADPSPGDVMLINGEPFSKPYDLPASGAGLSLEIWTELQWGGIVSSLNGEGRIFAVYSDIDKNSRTMEIIYSRYHQQFQLRGMGASPTSSLIVPFPEQQLYADRTIHLVFTHDNVTQTNHFYVDGILQGSNVSQHMRPLSAANARWISFGASVMGLTGSWADGRTTSQRVSFAAIHDGALPGGKVMELFSDGPAIFEYIPTGSPTSSPTGSPTSSPTGSPTSSPTGSPTNSPTLSPTTSPTTQASQLPSVVQSGTAVTGNVQVVSAVSVQGSLHITGSLTLTGSSSLLLSSASAINVTGPVTLGGTLQLTLDERPPEGQSVTLVILSTTHSQQVTGAFSSINASLPGDLRSCEELLHRVQGGSQTVSVVFSVDASRCGLSSGSIGAIAAGGVVFVLLVLFVPLALRRAKLKQQNKAQLARLEVMQQQS